MENEAVSRGVMGVSRGVMQSEEPRALQSWLTPMHIGTFLMEGNQHKTRASQQQLASLVVTH